MNESQVAQTLADNAAAANPTEPDAPAPLDTEVDHALSTAENLGALGEIMDYFNIQGAARHSQQMREEMGAILNYAMQNAETKDLAGMLRTLRETELVLGNTLKPDRIHRLHRYVVIQHQKQLLYERERSLY